MFTISEIIFKQLGFKTYTNHFFNFKNQIIKALIENSNKILTNENVGILFEKSPRMTDYTLMSDEFDGVFFQKEDADFIDNFRVNISRLNNNYKQA